ncbi:FAD-dependent oxidoreductase [bacterium]|nr:FAD-dependent oxidoreductase [bacterium]
MTGPGGRKRRVIVVGAGISGLMAARHLAEGGIDVIVLDKASGVGGRMATRRIGNLSFDHGAQFFFTTHPVFHRYVQDWVEQGALQPIAVDELMPGTNGHIKLAPEAWHGVNGMTDVPKLLAQHVDVRLKERVMRVDVRPGGWRLWTESANAYEADGLILTLPAPQSVQLLQHVTNVPEDLHARLRDIRYQPIYTLLLQLSGPSGLNGTGMLRLENENVSWILDNTRKLGQAAESAVTVQATPKFSLQQVENASDAVLQQVIKSIQPHLQSEPVSTTLHRWRYAWPLNPLDEPVTSNLPAPLALAGDAFSGEKMAGFMVEAAALSGLSAAANVYEMLASL